MPWSRQTRFNKGFTLVELLVTIAIIAILATLLLPALHRAQESGRLSLCKSNLKQISLGVGMYVQDTGYYPKFYFVKNGPGVTDHIARWDQAIEPYTMSRWTNQLYKCPSYKGVTESNPNDL